MPDEKDLSGLLRLLGPGLADLLSGREIILENVELDLAELELVIPVGGSPVIFPSPGRSAPEQNPGPLGAESKKKDRSHWPVTLLEDSWTSVPESYPRQIREVTLGATRSQGGTRGGSVTIGGACAPPFVHPSILQPHLPIISMDVFDTRVPMPRALKGHLSEVIDDPGAWAKMNVEKFGADMVTVHLLSTDPLIGNTSPKEASRTVEEVLQAVDVPLIIGGCGDPKKDALTFIEIAEMASGERLLLNSVTSDMAEVKTLEPVARAADAHGHCLLAFTGLDLNSAKELNRRLYQYFPADRIVNDLTSVALGYGLEYSFTIHERARIAGLMGDEELRHPTLSAATNAWSAREAWMDLGPGFGSSDHRGPLWETLGSLILLLAGVDLFLMMHPLAVSTLRDVSSRLIAGREESPVDEAGWAAAGIPVI